MGRPVSTSFLQLSFYLSVSVLLCHSLYLRTYLRQSRGEGEGSVRTGLMRAQRTPSDGTGVVAQTERQRTSTGLSYCDRVDGLQMTRVGQHGRVLCRVFGVAEHDSGVSFFSKTL